MCMNAAYYVTDRWRQGTNSLDASLPVTLAGTITSPINMKDHDVCTRLCHRRSVTFQNCWANLEEWEGLVTICQWTSIFHTSCKTAQKVFKEISKEVV